MLRLPQRYLRRTPSVLYNNGVYSGNLMRNISPLVNIQYVRMNSNDSRDDIAHDFQPSIDLIPKDEELIDPAKLDIMHDSGLAESLDDATEVVPYVLTALKPWHWTPMLLEFFHNSYNFTYIGGLVALICVFRVIQSPIVYIVEKEQAKSSHASPRITRARQKFMDAKRAGQPVSQADHQKEIQAINKKFDVKLGRQLMLLTTVPLNIVFFVGMINVSRCLPDHQAMGRFLDLQSESLFGIADITTTLGPVTGGLALVTGLVLTEVEIVLRFGNSPEWSKNLMRGGVCLTGVLLMYQWNVFSSVYIMLSFFFRWAERMCLTIPFVKRLLGILDKYDPVTDPYQSLIGLKPGEKNNTSGRPRKVSPFLKQQQSPRRVLGKGQSKRRTRNKR